MLGLLICAVPMVFGVWFAVRPSERVLSLMRPLTLMGIFSAAGNFFLGLANVAHAASRIGLDNVLAGLSEGFAPVAASFGCLTVAWACVVIGMRRT